MKKILMPLTLAVFTLALAGCYYPGYYGHDHYDGGGGYSDHGPGYGGDHGPGDGDHEQGPGGYNHP